MGLRDVARLGEQQRHRVLGRRDDVRLRGVDDHHAAGRRSVEVDIVESDSCPADDHQPVSRGEQLAIDRRRRADDQRLSAVDGVEQLAARQPESHIDGVTGAHETLRPTVGDLFGDEDARHGLHAYRPDAHFPRTTFAGQWTTTTSYAPSRSGSSLAASPTSSSGGLRPGTSGAGRSPCSWSPTCCSGSMPSISPTGRGCATSSPRCSCSPCSWPRGSAPTCSAAASHWSDPPRSARSSWPCWSSPRHCRQRCSANGATSSRRSLKGSSCCSPCGR